MGAARALRHARRRAGISQRELAARSGVPQSTIARIESGAVDPRVGTLRRLLRACGFDLEVEPLLGQDVDRSLLRAQLAMTPAERLRNAVRVSHFMSRLRAAPRRPGRQQAAAPDGREHLAEMTTEP
jgi:predicted transcriptional regulator